MSRDPRAVGVETARAVLASRETESNKNVAACWLAQNGGEDVLDDVVAFVRDPRRRHDGVLEAAVRGCGKEALPVLVAAMESWRAEQRVEPLLHLLGLGIGDATMIREAVARGLELEHTETLTSFLTLAVLAGAAPHQEQLWQLLGHRAKAVRQGAAVALGSLGDPVVERAAEVLGKARKAALRASSAEVLVALDTPAAHAALEARLEVEDADDVRDVILRGLEAAWEATGRVVTREEIDVRVERALARGLPALPTWLPVESLPLPRLESAAAGEVLSQDALRYLLFRQSRVKEMRPDVEAKPLYALIEEESGGELALAVLHAYLGSSGEAGERWALAFAACLGDDRIVPVLNAQIRDWADHRRGRMAAYAVQALAIRGSERALLAVDALAYRYRNKMKNIGRAASEALDSVAEILGMTRDELGDRIVPWLGFRRDGEPKVFEVGKLELGGRCLEMRVSLDFKLYFWDLDKNKRVASLPKAASDELKAEVKTLKATLREAVKVQLPRLEGQLVRQRRWPVGRWRELFGAHPVLRSFGVRLVWGCYGADGGLTGTFRFLEDRSLTTRDDDDFELPDDGSVGMVHPLELDADVRQAWREHLADYEIEPPFPQMERRVVRVEEGEREHRVFRGVAGFELNAFGFRGRAERRGWVRGSVTDGGGVSSYMKSFSGAGVDVFLLLDGMYMGIDRYEEVELGELTFVPSGSVEVGSYVYDEPAGDYDPRLLRFADVPPVVYSEVLGDLEEITGQVRHP